MADSQSIIALNIGSQRVSMGVFSQSKDGGLILKNYDASTILADPAAEMTRLPQVRIAVSELAQRLGVANQKADYTISGQSVFTRFVKLPVLDEDNIEQLVSFEAQQHVPFPINEVIWDWQMLDVPGVEKEVALVAIKGDALEELNDCVNEAGMTTGVVDASPMALANAFTYNYGDQEDTCLLIDVGARTSNLIYIEGKRIFTRSIAIGGAAITSAIAKEYGVSFTEAESQKVTNGMVALDTRHTSQLDELTAGLATCIRTALNRMPAEIARTTNFFRSQHGGSAPKRVFLAGAGANMPYIGEFFQEKLRLPIEFFNPMKRISVGQAVDVDRISSESHLLGELVGLALRSVDKAPLEIDLVPASIQLVREERRRRPYLIAAAGLTLAACAAFFATNTAKLSAEEAKVAAVEKRIKGLEQFSKPLKKAEVRETAIRQFSDQYVSAHSGQRYWLEVVDELKQRFGDRAVWVTDFSPVINFEPGNENVIDAINGEFTDVPYGKSGMSGLKLEPAVLSNGRPNPAYKAPIINAVKIKGFWRGAGGASKVVSLAQKLTKDSKYFTLEVVEAQGKKVVTRPLKQDEYIIESASSLKEGEYAAAYTLIIPLKQSIKLK